MSPPHLRAVAPPPVSFIPCPIPSYLSTNFTNHVDFSRHGNRNYYVLYLGPGQGLYSLKPPCVSAAEQNGYSVSQAIESFKTYPQVRAAWALHCYHMHSKCATHTNKCKHNLSCSTHLRLPPASNADLPPDAAATVTSAGSASSSPSPRTIGGTIIVPRKINGGPARPPASSVDAAATEHKVPLYDSHSSDQDGAASSGSAQVSTHWGVPQGAAAAQSELTSLSDPSKDVAAQAPSSPTVHSGVPQQTRPPGVLQGAPVQMRSVASVSSVPPSSLSASPATASVRTSAVPSSSSPARIRPMPLESISQAGHLSPHKAGRNDTYFVSATSGAIHHSSESALNFIAQESMYVVVGWDAARRRAEEVVRRGDGSSSAVDVDR
ncbi:hypothetical protein DFH07DRAFT_966622 [Mycena maculata]|uniref:Uncharacterized protein n=1 Tax=Mycena maculata TaxID=230809 RepID=A0AAD7MXD8_9AGAR|nr:hypothetical protein DFH07DRAFT_966622 [Mycena maculata]